MKRAAPACGQSEQVYLHASRALPREDVQALELHLTECSECRAELEGLRPAMDALSASAMDAVKPRHALWDRLAGRIAEESGAAPLPALEPLPEPDWEEVAPGISCKLLATDEARRRVSMLVRLAPGVNYPPHSHAGLEELHLLDGELWINERKLYPGDYNRAVEGTADQRVWSETGCTCVLITSPDDRLG